jgi:pyridinium-3,5-biscarboxylic acid mononucleotide sulfurtransferase
MIMNAYLTELKKWFAKHPGVLTALSGGVDSCLVAWVARQSLTKEQAIAVIGDSPSLKRRDLITAIAFCDEHDIAYHIIHPGELNDPNYKVNPEDRCFWCKSNLYTEMTLLRHERHPDFILVNGNNKSDLGDYRPGLQAAGKYNSFSPLAECGMTKEDIRELAREVGLKVWDKPASPCLSSRFPYGELITLEKLGLVEQAEEVLFLHGFLDARVRYFGSKARIEVPVADLPRLKELIGTIQDRFKELGFDITEIDEEGFVSGKLNRDLKGAKPL